MGASRASGLVRSVKGARIGAECQRLLPPTVRDLQRCFQLDGTVVGYAVAEYPAVQPLNLSKTHQKSLWFLLFSQYFTAFA